MSPICEICHVAFDGQATLGPLLQHQRETGHGDFMSLTTDGRRAHFNLSGLRGHEDMMMEAACEQH